MKAKISKLDPLGTIEESKEFYIPLIKKNKIQWIKLKDGTKIKGEPMKQSRYLLEIGEFKYFVRRNGEIELINESEIK
jgi:hypothetical protein